MNKGIMIESPSRPREAALHLLADWFELLCITSEFGELDEANVVEQLTELGRIAVEGYVGDRDFLEFEADDYERDDCVGSSAAETSDAIETVAVDVWAYLEARSKAFEQIYPFEVDQGFIALRSGLHGAQILYLYLLFCSSLSSLTSSPAAQLPAGFELLSYVALKNEVPSHWRVLLVGKNSFYVDPEFGESQKFKDKLKKVASLLNIDIPDSVKRNPQEFRSRDTGERGLDLLAWCPSEDGCPGGPIYFAQCACGKDWQPKQHSSGFDRWHSLLQFVSKPMNFLFIPYDFRNADRGIFRQSDIHLTVLNDRERIIRSILRSTDLSGVNTVNFEDSFPLDDGTKELRRLLTQVREEVNNA